MFFDILYIQILTYREEQNSPINNRNRGIGILYTVDQGVPGSVHLILDACVAGQFSVIRKIVSKLHPQR